MLFSAVMLRGWATGVQYRTPLVWFHAAALPVQAHRLLSETIVVGVPAVGTRRWVRWCVLPGVVLSVGRSGTPGGGVVTEYGRRGLGVSRTVTEIGSDHYISQASG